MKFLDSPFTYGNPNWCHSHVTIACLLFLLLAFSVMIVAICLSACTSFQRLPRSLPCADIRPGQKFPRVRACLRQYLHSSEILKLASDKFDKIDLPFILPMPNLQPIVILPSRHISWLLKQPESVISTAIGVREQSGSIWIIPQCTDALYDPMMFKMTGHMYFAMRLNSLRKLENLQKAMLEQIGRRAEIILGKNINDWKEVSLHAMLKDIILHIVLALFVGEPLSSDPAFQRACKKCDLFFDMSIAFLGSYSASTFRKLIGFPMRTMVSFLIKRCTKNMVPLIKDRWNNTLESDNISPFMTWLIEAARGKVYGTPERLAEIILLFISTATSTTPLLGTHVFLDLLSSGTDCIDRIQQEARTALEQIGTTSELSAISALPCIKSAIRESIRLNPANVTFPNGKVMSRNGVTLPSGHHLPYGTYVGIPTFAITFNSDSYPEPEQYHPFRFLKSLEIGAADELEVPATAVTDNFPGWGLGQHPCPGRWIAVTMLKLVIAYIMANYEIKPLAERPANWRIAQAEVPPIGLKIQIRRRRAT